jgi:excinuclease UvrABC nuclease subunit
MGKIDSSSYQWREANAKNIPKKAGVYELFEKHTEDSLIYIGCSPNLRERFTVYWETNFADDPCKTTTKWYKREVIANYKDREKELLEQYKDEHDGKLPRCNDKT